MPLVEEEIAKISAVQLRDTGDGIELIDSILSFDAYRTGKLSFLSSAVNNPKQFTPQILATEESIKLSEIYQKKKPLALVCQYNRPFSIGKLRIELLPSGSVLGGASLQVEVEGVRVLYAPEIQTHKLSTARQMQLKRSQILVLNASTPEPQAKRPPRKKEFDRLLSEIKSQVASDKWPIIEADAIGTAQEITRGLTDSKIPVSVDKKISKINRIYDDFGFDLGEVVLNHTRKSRPRVIITTKVKSKNVGRPIIRVHSNPSENLKEDKSNFVLSQFTTGSELKEVISAVCPSKLYFFGPYAKQYAEHYSSIAEEVLPLYPNSQPTLF